MTDTITESQHTGATIGKNILSRMIKQVDSGLVAKQFGNQYSRKGLIQTAAAMAVDVKTLTPGLGFKNQARELAILLHKYKSSQFDEKIKNKDYTTSPTHISRRNFTKLKDATTEEPPRFFYHFLSGAFYNYFAGSNPFTKFHYLHNVIQLEFEEGVPELDNMFHWNNLANRNQVVAKVKITDPVHPVAQEEYLHAAQEMTLGTVAGLSLLDSVPAKKASGELTHISLIKEASKHLTHASILIDRVLSSAAAEMGTAEFSYWAKRADQATRDFNSRHLAKEESPWEKTLLGKTVNKRFQYPIVDHEELGVILQNFTQDIEAFLFNKDGLINPGNAVLAELMSLQFGTTTYDLMRALLDLVPLQGKSYADSAQIGKQLIEWGKRCLRYYKGRPEEKELLTHHVEHLKPIDETHYDYQTTHNLIYTMNLAITRGGIPQPLLNLKKLADIAYDNSVEARNEILKYCILSHQSEDIVRPPLEVLKRYRLDYQTFDKIVEIARKRYRAYKKEQETKEKLGISKKIEDKVIYYTPPYRKIK